MSHTPGIEDSVQLQLDFQKLTQVAQIEADVVPVVVQDNASKDILILAYANEAALMATIATRKATFWSTSRNEIWVKGASSGDFLSVHEVRVNCEQNSLLYLVSLDGDGACHSKNKAGAHRKSCFYRRIKGTMLEFVES